MAVRPVHPSGEILRRHRFRAGLTQEELAERANLSVRGVRYLEQGHSRRPQVSSMRRLASALGLSDLEAAALLAGSTAPTTPDLSTVYIEILGPLRVRRRAVPVEITSSRIRTMLGFLALQPGQDVSTADIIDVVWGERPPRTCLELVHTYVGQLRALLEPGGTPPSGRDAQRLLRRVGGGYRLELDDSQLDRFGLDRTVDQAEQAAAAGDADRAVTLYGRACAQWRGPVLSGGEPRLRGHPVAVALGGRRLALVQRYADLAVAAGRPGDVVTVLRALLTEEPLHEGLAARLMLALAGDGQQAAALDVFHTTRDRLADELGVDPQPELRAVQVRILRGGVGAPEPAESTMDTGGHVGAPAQLPPDCVLFTGREDVLSTLDGLVAPHDAGPVLITLTGMGGVGKTSLAVRWAHRLRDRFPDGQLYVNLLGHGGVAPLRPLDALAGFLIALGVPAERIPDDEAQAAATYRSRMAGRRVLVLLDNAVDPAQVRPLLPTGAGSVTLVTGRQRLTGLVARDGARPVQLGLLPAAQAHDLLTRMLGERRVRTEAGAVADLARLCAYLPLALRIAAANLAARPGHPVREYADKLAAGDRLAALAVDGDPDTAVCATFDLSDATLSAPERRLLRMLGLMPAADITVDAAAALAGCPDGDAERILDQLAARHLVDEPIPGRYTLHDLLRLYAARRARTDLTAGEHADALGRLVEYYRDLLTQAADLAYPHVIRLESIVDTPSARRWFDSADAALAWLDGEQANLVMLVRHLADNGYHAPAVTLADLLHGYFLLRRYAVAWQRVAEAGLAAALAVGEPAGQAAAHMSLAAIHDTQSRFVESADHFHQALALAREADWAAGEAVVVNNLARIHWVAGRIPETIDQLHEALALNRRTGRRVGEAVVLANLGTAYGELARGLHGAERDGAIARARTHLTAALDINREIGDRRNESDTLRDLAMLLRDQDDLPGARALAEQAVELSEVGGDRRFIAAARNALATIQLRLGEHAPAETNHRDALAIARDIGDRHLIAQLQVEIGEARLRLGRHADVVAPAREALSLTAQTGSALLVARARALLAATGAPVADDDGGAV